MAHLSIENLVDYVEKKASEQINHEVECHLGECAKCYELKQELASLLTHLQEDASFEPPADLVQWGVSLFQPILKPSPAGKLRRIFASLIYDTYEQPMLAGVRRVGAPPRQLLFRAGDVDVDVRIESMEPNGRMTLAGQVLSGASKFFNNASVKLETPQGVVRFATLTNPVGEFTFDEVPGDTYNLSVDLPEGEITLFCVHRGNS